MRLIFRIDTKFGYHRADTLEQAKATSKEGDEISLVYAGDPADKPLTTRKRRAASPSWVMGYIRKHPEFCVVFF